MTKSNPQTQRQALDDIGIWVCINSQKKRLNSLCPLRMAYMFRFICRPITLGQKPGKTLFVLKICCVRQKLSCWLNRYLLTRCRSCSSPFKHSQMTMNSGNIKVMGSPCCDTPIRYGYSIYPCLLRNWLSLAINFT